MTSFAMVLVSSREKRMPLVISGVINRTLLATKKDRSRGLHISSFPVTAKLHNPGILDSGI